MSEEISEGTRFNFLFKLLTKTAEELNLEKVHWQNEGIFIRAWDVHTP